MFIVVMLMEKRTVMVEFSCETGWKGEITGVFRFFGL